MKNLEGFIKELLPDSGNEHAQLLQTLCSIQHRYSYIPETAIQFLTKNIHIPPDEILSVINFYAFLHTEPRGDFDILFSDNITDRMFGSEHLLEMLCNKLEVEPGIPSTDNRVTIDRTSCTGICDQGPALLVNGFAVPRLDEDRIHKIAELIEADTSIAHWPKDFFIIKR